MRPAAVLPVVLLAVLLAGCARKGDPLPPEGAAVSDAPRVTAPSQVTDPIRRGRRL